MDTLTEPEATALEACEATLSHYKEAAFDAGRALARIRDSRLYRQTHGTFEDYCRERWGLDDNHGRRLMYAAEIVDELQNESMPIGILPTHESQVRPLTALRKDPEKVREAWSEAVKASPTGRDGKPKVTAARVADAVRRVTDPDELIRRRGVSQSLDPGQPTAMDELAGELDKFIGVMARYRPSWESEPSKDELEKLSHRITVIAGSLKDIYDRIGEADAPIAPVLRLVSGGE